MAIRVDDAITCRNDKFYTKVLVPLLSQFSISKLEQSSFKFLGMHIKLTDDFSVHIRQDTKSIKRPDLTFLISDPPRSTSKTSDERLRVARALVQSGSFFPILNL